MLFKSNLVSKLDLNDQEAEKESHFRVRLQKELTAMCKNPIRVDRPFGDFDLEKALTSEAVHQVS